MQDSFGNIHYSSLEGFPQADCQKNNAVFLHTKTVPSDEVLKEHGLKFIRYDNVKNEVVYAQRNNSSMPWGPNHIVGARIIVKSRGLFLMSKESKGSIKKFIFPGGTVQIDGVERDTATIETFKGHPSPSATALQELYEELSIDLRKYENQLCLLGYACFKGVRKFDGIFANDICFVYLFDADKYASNTIDTEAPLHIDPNEISEYSWKSFQEICQSDDVTDMSKVFLGRYVERNMNCSTVIPSRVNNVDVYFTQ